MKPEFWLQAWEEGKRGFHLSEANPRLLAHHTHFEPQSRILVPLCGATHDLRWLADQGHHAVGVEISPLAVQELVERESLATQGVLGPFQVYGDTHITLLQGDFFGLTRDIAGSVDGIWDRAALVAMHPSQREAYVTVQRSVLGPGGQLLLNTLSYDQSKMDGPPWSVPDTMVTDLWPEVHTLSSDTSPAQARWKAEGIDSVTAWMFTGRI